MAKEKVAITAQNVKRILFNVKFEGNGIVNYDNAELQIDKMFKVDGWNTKLMQEGKVKRNLLLAKKVFTKTGVKRKTSKGDEYDVIDYKLMVSRNCIMHDMYREVDMAKSASIMNNPTELYLDVTSSESLTRGYMYAPANKTGEVAKMTIRKKGAVTLTDAIQTCNAQSNLVIGVNHKEKVVKENKSDPNANGDTSMFEREHVGHIKYESTGNFINLAQLEFVPAMAETDRVSFNPDMTDLWKQSFDMNMLGFGLNSNDDVSVGHFKLSSSQSDIKEFGLLLSKRTVNTLVKDFFTRLMNLRINRSGSTMNVSEITVSFENDNLEVDGNNEKEFIVLTPQNLSTMEFDYISAYTQLDDSLPNKGEVVSMEVISEEPTQKTKSRTSKKKETV